jgi:hypothetical protein
MTVRAELYPERVGCDSEPLQGLTDREELLVPGLPKLNPGLELANTFGVGFDADDLAGMHSNS